MNTIFTEKAPKPVGPYSQAVQTRDLLFISGQLGIDPLSGKLEEGVEKQAERAFQNLAAILETAHCTRENVVKVNIFLSNMEDFSLVNNVYSNFFGEHKPARAAIGGLSLPLNAKIEIEAVAENKT